MRREGGASPGGRTHSCPDLEQHPGKHVLQSPVPLPALPGRDNTQVTEK